MDVSKLQASARRASYLLKAMSNEHRLLILCQLVGTERSVGELVKLVGLSQSALSQHLARLRRERLVKTRRDAQTIYYSVASDEALTLLKKLYEIYCARAPVTTVQPGTGMSGQTATRLSSGPSRTGTFCAGAACRLGLVATLLALVVGAWPARAATFVADLSDHIIAITTAFSGADVLLFGAVDSPGDVVVLIRGDPAETEVRRKSPVGPIWINTRSVSFRDVPEFYTVAATRPLNEIAPPAELARYQIGPENLRLVPVQAASVDGATAAQFRQGLIRRKQQQGMFPTAPGLITFLGDTLFRTRIAFPANVPPGFYSVEVLKFEDGAVTAAQTTSLQVGKTGLEADLYDFALRQPALYGLASIVIAVGAGWLASIAFGRGTA